MLLIIKIDMQNIKIMKKRKLHYFHNISQSLQSFTTKLSYVLYALLCQKESTFIKLERHLFFVIFIIFVIKVILTGNFNGFNRIPERHLIFQNLHIYIVKKFQISNNSPIANNSIYCKNCKIYVIVNYFFVIDDNFLLTINLNFKFILEI